MKKLFISGLFALAIISSAFAAPANTTAKAMDHFTGLFANAKSVSWKITDTYKKATFTENNQKVEVFYDSYGDLLGTSKSMAFDKLPKSALETITTKYTFPEYQLTDCIEFTSASNEKSYYVSFDTEDQRVVLEISKRGAVSVMSTDDK